MFGGMWRLNIEVENYIFSNAKGNLRIWASAFLQALAPSWRLNLEFRGFLWSFNLFFASEERVPTQFKKVAIVGQETSTKFI